MQLYDHWKDFPDAEWRWKNFSPQEMACRGDDMLGIDFDAMDRLQELRDALGRPVIVNSAYRSPEYNARVGGVANSQHLRAKAFDISMGNQSPGEFEAAARRAGFTGFGFYPKQGFIHIDTGPPREWGKRWFGRSVERLAEAPSLPRPDLSESRTITAAEKQRKASQGGVLAGIGVAVTQVADAVIGETETVLEAAGIGVKLDELLPIAGGVLVAVCVLLFIVNRAQADKIEEARVDDHEKGLR